MNFNRLALLLCAAAWVCAPVRVWGAPASQPASTPVSAGPTLVVRRFDFAGNTKFTTEQLRRVVAKYVGRPLTEEDLEQARQDLTLFYVKAGYINSGAVLPDQTVSNGVVAYQIVEGKMSDVKLDIRPLKVQLPNGKIIEFKSHLLRDEYVKSRVNRGAEPPPLDIVKLKDQLELLREDPNIQSINAELRPGATPGDSYLDVQVQETNPFQAGLQFSNRRPPSVGSTAFDFLFSDHDTLGFGDLFAVRYDVAHGPLNDFQLAGGDDFSLDYSIPVTPSDTTVSVDFTRTDALVVQAPFTDLNIKSLTDSLSATVRQPLYRRPISDAGKPSLEVALFLTGTYRDNTTSLLGSPFSFSPGAVNGHSRVTALRFGQEALTRSRESAFSARSTFSFGINTFGATPDRGPLPGGNFVAWLGQAQYVRLIPKTDTQFVARVAGQLADRSLLSIEQFAIGGMDTVRGYPEEELLRDQGVVGTIELHVPIIRGKGGAADVLDLVPFYDAGFGNNKAKTAGVARNQFLDSAGLGLVFTPNTHVTAQLFYGYPFRTIEKSHRDVEDLGIHFNVLLQLF